eukprot:TRINITY_DN18962_c0_g1_i1.p1 TRINITY_DN18962_c0_g1~~TRINITY_DN18962_c0_g1_i1.p1  ORF type:complete len:517 (-),score=87.81 TRINITY_DN18962_c0_g1_i1:80-1429(-)
MAKPLTRSSLSFAKQLVENFGNEDYYDDPEHSSSLAASNLSSPKVDLRLYLDKLCSLEPGKNLLALPEEVIWNCMLFLPASEIVIVGQVSRSSQQICLKNEVLWGQLLKRDFDVHGNPNINPETRPSILYSSVYSRSMRARKNRIAKLANRKAQEKKTITQERIKSWYDWLHSKFVPLCASALSFLGCILLAMFLDNDQNKPLSLTAYISWLLMVIGFWLSSASYFFVKKYHNWWQFALLKDFDGPGLLNVLWEDAFRSGKRAVIGMSGFWSCLSLFVVLLFIKLHDSSNSWSFAQVFIPIWLSVGFLAICPFDFWGNGRIGILYWTLAFIPFLVSSILLVVFLDSDKLHLWIVLMPIFIIEGIVLVLIMAVFILTFLNIMQAAIRNLFTALAVYLALVGPVAAFQVMLCVKIDAGDNSGLNFVKVFSPLFVWHGMILCLCLINLYIKQ